MEVTPERFKDDPTVKTVAGTQIVEVSFRSPDPAQATNAGTQSLTNICSIPLTARVQDTAQVSQWILEQMQEIRANTTAAQELAAFQRNNNRLERTRASRSSRIV